MSETKPTTETSPPVNRHERTDANTRNLMWFGVGLLGLIVFGFVVTEVTFHYFVGHQKFAHPTTLFTKQQMPPAPLIQEHPGQQLQGYLKQQDKMLDSYGWVDRKAGIVRIPISQAMNELLQKGLPVRTGPPTLGVSRPTTIPRGDFAPPPAGGVGPQLQ
ncbi:MAG: hypothetical protein ACRD18_08600 [Terriglobia bacterium]